MRKFIFSLVIMMMTVFSANAQVATQNSKLFDNTYVGVGVGVSTPLNFDSMFPVNTVVGIKFGKELTPVFGFELEGLAVLNDNFNRYGTNGSLPIDGGMFNVHQTGSINTFVKATNVGLNGVINWSNLVCGYNGTPRFFEVKTNTGFGWGHYFGNYTPHYVIGGWHASGKRNVLTAKTGFDFAFNLGEAKAHTITVSPAIYWNLNEVGNVKFNKNYAQLGVMIGYAYHFKTSNKTHAFKTYDIGAMNAQIAYLTDQLAKKPNEVVKEVVKEVTHETGFGVKETVFFAFDSAELDDNAKATLDKLGENGIYVVRGYASNEGSTEYNKALSLRRAEAVAEYLRNRGARIDTVEGLGVVFGPTTGRVAVITNK